MIDTIQDPTKINSIKASKKECCTTITSTNSWVNLNADVSKPRFLPGEMERMKPKSMWITWPSASSKMFPLCLNTTHGNILIILINKHGYMQMFCQK